MCFGMFPQRYVMMNACYRTTVLHTLALNALWAESLYVKQ